MGKTKLQKWIRFMKGSLPQDSVLPERSATDKNKTLVTDSSGTPQWGKVVSSDIPLSDDEGIMIYKLPSEE